MTHTSYHAAPASIQSSGTPVAALPVFSPRTLLQLLWERAHQHMTPQELQWLADKVPEFSCFYAAQLEVVLQGVGCLVAADGQHPAAGHGGAGSFQHHAEVQDLLFAHANQMSLLSGMARIAGDAAALSQHTTATA